MKILKQLFRTGPKSGDNLSQMINYLLNLTHDRMELHEIKEEIHKEKKTQEVPPMKAKKNPTIPRQIQNWGIGEKYPKNSRRVITSERSTKHMELLVLPMMTTILF